MIVDGEPIFPVEVDENGLYPNRNCMHKWMAPPEFCGSCHGRGYYMEGYGEEVYCKCLAGEKRREVDHP